MPAGRRVAAILALVGAVALVGATAAVTDVTGVRNADVTVAAEGGGYLGLDGLDPTLRGGRHESVPLVTLSNGAPMAFEEITVSVADGTRGPPHLREFTGPSRLAVDDDGTVVADVVCGGRGTETWTVDVRAVGGGMTVTATRTVAVTCEAGPPTRPSGKPPQGGPDGPPNRLNGSATAGLSIGPGAANGTSVEVGP